MPDPMIIARSFAAAALLGLVVALPVARSSRVTVASAGALLGLLGALCAGSWVLGLLPHWPPQEAVDRLLLIVVPAAAVAELIAGASARAGWVARSIVAALATPVLLHGSIYVTDLSGPGSREWATTSAAVVFAALAVLLMGAWWALERLARRTHSRTPLWCVAGATLGAGLVIMLSGYATGGQLGVPLAAGLVGVALGSLAGKETRALAGTLGTGVVSLFALLVVGRLFAELTNLNAVLLFAAPLLGWLPELVPARPRLRPALRLALPALPVIVALVLAQQNFAANSRPQAGGGSLDDYMSFGK